MTIPYPMPASYSRTLHLRKKHAERRLALCRQYGSRDRAVITDLRWRGVWIADVTYCRTSDGAWLS